MMEHLLSLTTFLPLAGALLIVFFIPGARHREIRVAATAVAVLDMALAFMLWWNFDAGSAEMQFSKSAEWIPAIGASYSIGLDGVGLLLYLLTALLGVLVVVGAYTAVTERVKEFYVMLLLMQCFMLGLFMSLDLFLFYVFWELTLVPMYILIGIWGSDNKLYSAIKFFLYTLFGSVFLLVGLLALYLFNTTGIPFFGIEGLGNAPSLSMEHFYRIAAQIPPQMQFWVFLALFLGFAVKVPMFPFHTWLPDAHTDAPTAGSVILAGVLLKMGTYGFFRIAMPMVPQGFFDWQQFLVYLCLIAIVYGAFVCLVQRDMKRLVAYSSVSHMGYVMLGLFAVNAVGLKGGLLQMLNHGFSTGALFFLVGMIYERRHTRMIRDYGGLSQVMPVYAAFFMVIALASLGLPGLNGFVGEFMVILGAYAENFWWAFWAAFGVILAAAYLLWLYQRVFFGPVEREENKGLKDLSLREIGVLAPLVIFCVWIGIYPGPFLRYLEPPVDNLLLQMDVSSHEDLEDILSPAPAPLALPEEHEASASESSVEAPSAEAAPEPAAHSEAAH
jgi:NADH-quinone oxidoreductase subunit M